MLTPINPDNVIPGWTPRPIFEITLHARMHEELGNYIHFIDSPCILTVINSMFSGNGPTAEVRDFISWHITAIWGLPTNLIFN